MTVRDEELTAWIDGELPPERAAEIAAAVAADPALAARAETHRALKARLAATYDPVAAEPAPDPLVELIRSGGEPRREAEVVVFRRPEPAKPAPKAPAAAPRWAVPAAIAAMLLVGFFVFGPPRFGPAPLLESRDGALVASPVLAGALDRQTAADAGASPVLVGLSFATAEGQYCRTFQGRDAALAGLACKENGRWAVRVVERADPAGRGEMRTAASGTPVAVAAAVDALMAGDPLDAAGETRARERGWTPIR